jgi:uncharacterized protein YwqG
VEQVMKALIASWPPQLPVVDHRLEQEYARSGGEADLAARVLEPFRFRSLGTHWDDIVVLARPSARFSPGGDSRVGGSRIGGVPDVPAGFVWPHFRDAPLGFVAQINLRDVQAVYPNSLVPESGLLSFFYDAKQEVWGFDPADRGRWGVFYFDAPVSQASRIPTNLPRTGQYQPVPLQAEGELTIPAPDSLEIERFEFAERARNSYWALEAELAELRPGSVHRFLGWPQEIQHDPASEVQLPASGINAGGPEGYQSEEGQRLMAKRDVWQLLLQVDSDEAARMMWGDAGRLYYMMRRDQLASRDWAECWFSLQCY